MFHYYNIFYFCRTEKSMQDYEETQELNTIAPEKIPSPDYPPEVSIEMSIFAWRMMSTILLVYFQYGHQHFNLFENVHILFAWDV